MGYKYGVSSGLTFSGGVIVDKEPLRSVWSTDSPVWQFVQYTPVSPAQSPSGQYYPGLETISKTFAVFEAFGVAIARFRIRKEVSIFAIPDEAMSAARSLYLDGGQVPETVEDFAIKVYAPIGVGFYWFPRSLVWGFPPNP